MESLLHTNTFSCLFEIQGELKRGQIANSIHCYMCETGVSEKVARKHMSNMIDRCWKKMNEERVVDSPFGEGVVVTAINLARIA